MHADLAANDSRCLSLQEWRHYVGEISGLEVNRVAAINEHDAV
jgi:hypothetical protein